MTSSLTTLAAARAATHSTIPSPLTIVLVVAAVGWVLWSRMKGQPQKAKRLLVLPAVLTVLGITDLTGSPAARARRQPAGRSGDRGSPGPVDRAALRRRPRGLRWRPVRQVPVPPVAHQPFRRRGPAPATLHRQPGGQPILRAGSISQRRRLRRRRAVEVTEGE